MKKLILIAISFIALNAVAQNVGIGTSTPAYKLDVNGNLNIKGDSSIYISGTKVLSINGSHNLFLGIGSGNSNTSGMYNTSNGSNSLQNNTTGWLNTAIGSSALYTNVTGSYNTAVGFNALYINTGSYNSAMGYDADVSSSTVNYSTIIGYGTTATASYQMRFGNSSVTSIGGQVGWTTISDARVKTNIQSNVPGLDFILKLKPVTYNIDVTTLDKLLRPDGFKNTQTQEESDAKTVKLKIVYTGFIAQDVEAIAKQVGYDFSGVDAPKNDKDLYGIRYAEFVVPLVKAVQEMNKQNQDQQVLIEQLLKDNAEMKIQINSLLNK